jgi:hypothetical protein
MAHNFAYLDAQPPQERTAEAGLSQADYVVTATRLLRDLRGIADGRGVPLGKLLRKL